jgi:lysylphosphatidylglycerol synthetase-like protein (DUF2156 family)
MVRRIVAWLPWLLAGASLAWAEARFWPDGGLWLVVIWTSILLLYRGLLSLNPERGARLFFDLLFAGFCFIAVFEGGWFVLPAVAAFAVCDAFRLRIRLPSIPNNAQGHELRLAFASTLTGLAGLAIAISGPLYSSATTTVYLDGTTVATHSPAPLLQSDVTLAFAAVLVATAVLFVLVTLLAALHLRSARRAAWLALVVATGSLVLTVVLSVVALGPWLAPGAALAVAAVAIGRSAPLPSANAI